MTAVDGEINVIAELVEQIGGEAKSHYWKHSIQINNEDLKLMKLSVCLWVCQPTHVLT